MSRKILPFFPPDRMEFEWRTDQLSATYTFQYNESANLYEFSRCDYKTRNNPYQMSDFIALKVLTDEMQRNLRELNQFLTESTERIPKTFGEFADVVINWPNFKRDGQDIIFDDELNGLIFCPNGSIRRQSTKFQIMEKIPPKLMYEIAKLFHKTEFKKEILK